MIILRKHSVNSDWRIMSHNIPPEQPAERRSELRKNEKPMRSVELKLPSLPIYLFKVKDSSQNGFCLLVKEDSNILEHIHVGQILNIKSYSEDNMESSEILLSEIRPNRFFTGLLFATPTSLIIWAIIIWVFL